MARNVTMRRRSALTSRPLPADGGIDALSRERRDVVASVWIERAASERRVGDAFDVIRAALAQLGASESLVAVAKRAVDDERRHAEICRVVASRYAGRELAAPPRLALVVPAHESAGPELRRVLHVVGHCALNETFSSAFLEASLRACDPGAAPLARAGLRELLSDEIHHARLGWAVLASLDASTRAAVAPWLPRLAAANLRAWRTAPRTLADGDPGLRAHGVLSAAEFEAALLGAVRDVVIPGVESVDLDAAPLRAWLSAGAPT